MHLHIFCHILTVRTVDVHITIYKSLKTIPVNQKLKLQPASKYFLQLALDDVSESRHP